PRRAGRSCRPTRREGGSRGRYDNGARSSRRVRGPVVRTALSAPSAGRPHTTGRHDSDRPHHHGGDRGADRWTIFVWQDTSVGPRFHWRAKRGARKSAEGRGQKPTVGQVGRWLHRATTSITGRRADGVRYRRAVRATGLPTA